MKKLLSLVAVLMLLSITAITKAQTPQAIKYQAIARNAGGEVIANQNVSFRITILQGSAEGTPVYQEVQTTTTNQFGLANLEIGRGNITTGLFDSIKWGSATYFAKIEFDPKGGNDYALMGTSQLLSVPYSLYAEHAKVADNLPVFPIKASLQATNLQAPFNAPETGMLVYNTDSAGTAPNNVVPGYYYNAGTTTQPNWVLLSGTDIAKNTKRAFATGTGVTTYGGLSQDGNGLGGVGSVVSNPSGNDNTGFGYNVFGNNASTNPSGTDNTGVGYEAMNSLTTESYNTAVGSQALFSDQTGLANTAVGEGALFTNVASYNTALGSAALYSNNNGTDNVAVGYASLSANTSGSDNTASGYESMIANQGGGNNSAYGFASLFTNVSGANNVSIGAYSLFNNTANNNTAVGLDALMNNTTGTNNTATGYLAMNGTSGSSTGSSNTANGAYALYNNSTGDWNTAMGDSAEALNKQGVGNTAMGYGALYTNLKGGYNTAIGFDALYSYSGSIDAIANTAVGSQALYNTTGFGNTSIGRMALFTNTTGENNTAIGNASDVGAISLNYATAIGAGANVNANNAMVLGGANSNSYVFVGIGTTTPNAELDLKDPSTDAATNCHIKSEGTLPTIAVTTQNGITVSAVSSGSTDTKGNVTTTGTNNGTGNTVLTITFNKAFNIAPIIVITPATAGAQGCTYFVTSTTTAFTVNFKSGAATPSFNYFVIE